MNENYKLFCKRVGALIREKRAIKQYKGTEIAEKLGISPITYRNCESGQRLFTPQQMDLLGYYFNFDIAKEIDLISKEITKGVGERELTTFDIDVALGHLKPENIKDINIREDFKDIIIANREIQRYIRKRENSSLGDFNNAILEAVRCMENKYSPVSSLEAEDKVVLIEMCRGVIDEFIQRQLRIGKYDTREGYKVDIAPNGVNYRYKKL